MSYNADKGHMAGAFAKVGPTGRVRPLFTEWAKDLSTGALVEANKITTAGGLKQAKPKERVEAGYHMRTIVDGTRKHTSLTPQQGYHWVSHIL